MMLIRLAIRNVFRNTRRSLLTAGMVTLGSALLCLAIAWMQGVIEEVLAMATASAGHVRVVDPEFAKLEKMLPLYANVPNAQGLAAEIGALESVAGAYPRIGVGVIITNTEEIGDHFALLLGAPLELYSEQYHLNDQLVQGSGWFKEPRDMLLGRKVASEMGVEIGDKVDINGMTQDGSFSGLSGTVVGIVAGENPVQERQVFMALAPVQHLTDIPDGATEVLVFGTDRSRDQAMAKEIRGLAATKDLMVQEWSTREPWAGMVAMFDVINGIIMIIIIFITSLGVWNTMTISVLERTGEIGVLRAMGMKRLSAVALFVLEAMMIGILGGVLGVILGGIPAYYLEVVGVSIGEDVIENMDANTPFSRILRADLNGFVVGITFMTALSMSLVGSALPSLRAALIQPVEAMRARR